MAGLTGWQRWWVDSWPHRWFVRRHVPHFLKMAPDPFRGEVLEVGAGSGWTSQRILETFPQVELTATDNDQRFADRLMRLGNTYGTRLTFKAADVSKLPFDRGAFDIVIAMNVLRYIEDAHIRPAMQQMLRVLRPGGLLGLSDYVLWSSAGPTRADIEQILRAEECEIVFAQGNTDYDLWARKAYPVTSTGGDSRV